MSPIPGSQALPRSAALAGGYLLAALCSAQLVGSGSTIPAVPLLWLPAGVVSAAALRMGWASLPGLALGGLLTGAAGLGGELGGSLLPCLGATAITLLAPRLMRSTNVLGRPANLLMFLAAAGAGALAQVVFLATPAEQGLLALMSGHILLGPCLATWLAPQGRHQWRQALSLESLAALVAMLLLVALIASRITPALSALPGFALMPVLLWAAFRLPPASASSIQLLGGLLLLIVQASSTSAQGPEIVFQNLRLASGTVLMSQLLLAVTQERSRIQRHLERHANRLRLLVRLRTQQLEQANARLQNLSECDGLTGVANRRHFDAVLEREWRRALRRSEPLTIGLLDVDHFKAYNDGHGHLEGDETLRRVAGALNAVTGRAEDLLARYGGEEFAVILPGLDRHDAHRMAERLRSAVADLTIPHGHGGVDGMVTISGGLVSWVPQPEGNPQELLLLADQLLYAAKARGRNRVLVQAVSLDDSLNDSLSDAGLNADVTSAAS